MSGASTTDLRARVARLDASQRQELRERLQDAQPAVKLIAYVVPRDPRDPPDAAELRDYLRERLPEVMLPSAFVVLEEGLPRLPNGKVDVRALPQPGAAQSEVSSGLVEPRTEAERTLARIWAEVLGADVIGVNDNFFELGGDSILSIRVLARAQQAGLRLEPDEIFRHQTLGALAAAARPAAPVEPAVEGSGEGADAGFPHSGLTRDELDRFLGTILP